MRLIDADALKEEVNKKKVVGRFNTIVLIDNAPTVEPERPQGDLISREALKKAIINNFDNLQAYFPKDFIEEIDNAPTVDVISNEEGYEMYGKGYLQGYERCKSERPKGEWIKEPNGKTTDIYRCSVCKRSIMLCKGADLTNYPFCHCGADMGGKGGN